MDDDQLFADLARYFDLHGSTSGHGDYDRIKESHTQDTSRFPLQEYTNRQPDGVFDGIHRLHHEPQFGWLDTQVCPPSPPTCCMFTSLEDVPKQSKRRSKASVQRMRRRNNRRCLAGSCCVHNVRFNPLFKCPRTGCRHQCVWNTVGVSDECLCHPRILQTGVLQIRPPPITGCHPINDNYLRFPEFARVLHGIHCRKQGSSNIAACPECNPLPTPPAKRPSPLSHLSGPDRLRKSRLVTDRWRRRFALVSSIPID